MVTYEMRRFCEIFITGIFFGNKNALCLIS